MTELQNPVPMSLDIPQAAPAATEALLLPAGVFGAEPTVKGSPSEPGPQMEQGTPPEDPPETSPVTDTSGVARFYPDFMVPLPSERECLDALQTLAQSAYFDLSEEAFKQPVHEIMEMTLGTANQIVSRGAGAAVYIVAAWDDGDRGTQVYESLTNRLEHVFSSDTTQPLRQGFLRIVHGELGPTFGRDLRAAWPSIYGATQNDHRPRVPPEHPDDDQERWIIYRFCTALRGTAADRLARNGRGCARGPV
ncbi:hypothetical protein FRC08_000983 [Ceratobasidium sp. 394]|nr:hypothetical protein FRC08_000983 [Ceratobasidium sp. 394]